MCILCHRMSGTKRSRTRKHGQPRLAVVLSSKRMVHTTNHGYVITYPNECIDKKRSESQTDRERDITTARDGDDDDNRECTRKRARQTRKIARQTPESRRGVSDPAGRRPGHSIHGAGSTGKSYRRRCRQGSCVGWCGYQLPRQALDHLRYDVT